MEEIKNLMKKQFNDFLDQTEPKDLIKSFENENGINSIVEVFYNALIKAEFEMFMGYKKYDRGRLEKTNYRNGSHAKKLKTENGEINLTIPEDRNYEFESSVVPKHARRSEYISRAIIQLFAQGNSNSEVVKFVDEVFGASYSPQNISTIVEVLDEVVLEFNSRVIESEYFAIYMDATYIPVQFNGEYSKHAIYLIVGVNKQGYQDILGYTIGFSENVEKWSELLNDLKVRGLRNCDIFIMDGAPGIPSLVRSIFPNTKVQICTVHLMRNLTNKLKVKDKGPILSRVKQIFNLYEKNVIEAEVSRLIDDYPQYRTILKNFYSKEYIFSYIEFPYYVHKLIKTTNRIERLNGKIKTLISHKRQFPNKESLERILVSAILETNSRSTRTCQGMQEYIENN